MKGDRLRRDKRAELFAFYNERLKSLGIDEQAESVTQLTQMDRISAAVAGVGRPLLALWLLGRSRLRATETARTAERNAAKEHREYK
jgi:hypothetical protein